MLPVQTRIQLPILAFAALLCADRAACQADLIAISWSGSVYGVDSNTGTATLIGAALPNQNALGLDGNGTLWATHRSGPTGSWVYHLTNIDPMTGAGTIVYSGIPDLRGLTGAGGALLYGIQDGSPDQLVTVDTATGTVTPIGGTNFTGQQALALHQGVLYSWDINQGLLVVDQTTGLATDPWPAVGGPAGLQFMMSHPDGRLLVGRDSLYSLDVTTGVATFIGAIGTFDLRGCEPLGGGFIQSFGTACNGAFGPTVLTATGLPQVGSSITTLSSNHAASSLGALVFGFSNTTYMGLNLPFDLTPVLGTSNCFLYVSIDANLIGFTNANMPADLSFTLPLPPVAAGLRFHLQHACFEPVPGGLSWSNGLTVQVQ